MVFRFSANIVSLKSEVGDIFNLNVSLMAEVKMDGVAKSMCFLAALNQMV
jgi:hypothetical protein